MKKSLLIASLLAVAMAQASQTKPAQRVATDRNEPSDPDYPENPAPLRGNTIEDLGIAD